MQPTVSFVCGALPCAEAQGLGLTDFYAKIRLGMAPSLVQLSHKIRALPLHEISAVNALRLAGVGGEQLRQIVAEIVESRTQGLRAPDVVAGIVERVLSQRCAYQKERASQVAA